jgi:hypothetical protein
VIAIRAGFCALAVCLLDCTRQEPPSNNASTRAAPLPAPSVGDKRQPKPRSAQECQKTCNGEWSAHGLSGVLSCLCRTGDSGKDCRDKAECQGECLLEPLRSEVLSPGPPAIGFFIGKCSEFVTTFGCARRIQAGTKDRGPVDLSEPPPQICLD